MYTLTDRVWDWPAQLSAGQLAWRLCYALDAPRDTQHACIQRMELSELVMSYLHNPNVRNVVLILTADLHCRSLY